MLLLHFFFFLLKWHKERCELLIFLSFINIPLKSFLPLISFRVLSACPLWDFFLIYLLAHFFVLYICLVYLPLHLSCMAFWRRSIPTRWVLLDKGGIVVRWQVQSKRGNGEWWTIMHACMSFASVRFESALLTNIVDSHVGSSARLRNLKDNICF